MGDEPVLYEARSSYASVIARLALVEREIPYLSHQVDIHRRAQHQQSEYARINPKLILPSLVLPSQTIFHSRDIVVYAFGYLKASDLGVHERFWLDLHDNFPMSDLVLHGLIAADPIARLAAPYVLRRTQQRLLSLAAKDPKRAQTFEERAEIIAGRLRDLRRENATTVAANLHRHVTRILDTMEQVLKDGRGFLIGMSYTVADCVMTVFLARLCMVRLYGEINCRPALSSYWELMQARPSFEAADLRTKMHSWKMIREWLL